MISSRLVTIDRRRGDPISFRKRRARPLLKLKGISSSGSAANSLDLDGMR
jgi:hypothetical protein